MRHYLVVLDQVCSNEGPWIQDGPAPGGPRLKPYKYCFSKSSSSELLRRLKFNMQHYLVVFHQIRSNGGLGVQNGPVPESPRFEP